MVGVNRFEHVEAAYCLSGYYVAPAAVERLTNDLVPNTDHHRVRIETTGDPPRRRVRLAGPRAGGSVLDQIAPELLVQKEADVIVQGVGRVRPFTSAREVITFHAGGLPGVRYAAEFLDLAQARAHFGLRTPSQAGRDGCARQCCGSRPPGGRSSRSPPSWGKLSTIKRRMPRRGSGDLK